MTVTVTIAGTPVPIKYGSLQPGGRIEERSRCSFIVRDDAGTMVFHKGQPVSVDDTVQGNIFKGVVNSDNKTLSAGTTRIWHAIDCVDPQVFVDAHVSQKQYSTPQYAGVILVDHAQSYLAAEGITVDAALDIDSTQSDFAEGTLSGVNAIADGLILSASGTDYVSTIAKQNIPVFNAIKFVATCSSGYNNPYIYRKIWSGSYLIQSGDTFTYDIWIQSDSPEFKCGFDLSFSDGTTLRQNSTANDSHGMAAHPGVDLRDLAADQWYQRAFGLGDFVGKTLVSASIVFEGDSAGTYTAYARRCWIYAVSTGTHRIEIFTDASTALQKNILASNNGYNSDALSVVQAHEKSYTAGYGDVITNIGIAGESSVVWDDPQLPDDAQFIMRVSGDDEGTLQEIDNSGAVPTLLPGSNTNGITFTTRLSVVQGKDPTAAIALPAATYKILSAPANTLPGTDVRQRWRSDADWNTGTHNATKTNGSNNLLMSGYTASFATIPDYNGNTTFFGSGSAFALTLNQALGVQATNGDARIRLDGYGTWRQDFVAEVDVLVSQSYHIGIEYRTSNWGNGRDSYAYSAMVAPASANTYQIAFGRGSNSGSTNGTYTVIQTVTNIKITDNTWHRLKILIVGNVHTIYLDDFPYVNGVTDATHQNTNNLALRVYNPTTGTQTGSFKNFGVSPMALASSWTSAAIDLSGVQSYGDSRVAWTTLNTVSNFQPRPVPVVPPGASIGIQASIDGGSTWSDIPQNNSPIPGLTPGQSLAGKSLLLRVNLATPNASAQPFLGGLSVWVRPSYSASGTRVSPALALDDAGRAGTTLVAWNASEPDGTNIVVESSLDGGSTWQSASNGGEISGIDTASQTIDSFDTDTSSSYTSTFATGGAAATWTWDTENSRLIATGGTNAYLKRNSFSALDQRVIFDMDRAENAGVIIRLDAFNDFYILAVCDDSAANHPNTLSLWKQVGASVFMLGSYNTISFQRGVPHRFIFEMIGGQMNGYMDGELITSFFDASAITGASAGLFNNGGTAQFYTVRFEAYGDTTAGKSVQTRVTLTSTDPSITPQILDLTAGALGPQIGLGALIQPKDYRLQYVTDVIKDLATKSNYIWNVKFDKSMFFQARMFMPSPWILTSKDILVQGLGVDESADLYRNQQIIKGVVDTIAFNETKTGDGSTTSWALSYKLASAPTITLNGQIATVGQKGIDSGKDFYWEAGSETITQDASGTKLTQSDTLGIQGMGQYEHSITVDNTSLPGTITQSQYAAITGGSGIVTMVEDVSGQGLNTTAATELANALLVKYGIIGRTVRFRTRRSGLATAQYQPTFIPEFGLQDLDLLLTEVSVDITGGDSTLQFWWSVTGVSGPNLGSWSKLMGSITS